MSAQEIICRIPDRTATPSNRRSAAMSALWAERSLPLVMGWSDLFPAGGTGLYGAEIRVRSGRHPMPARVPDAHRGGMTQPNPPYRQLRRPTTDRMVAGVASGLG